MPVVFRAIKAKVIDWDVFNKEISDTLDSVVKPELIAYFDKVTASWNNQPQFKARKIINPTGISIEVKPSGPNKKIWEYVSFGTRPHPIKPRGKGYPLRFMWGGYGSYKARTTTSGGYNGPGKVVGGKVTFRMRVKHPGNKARNFEKHIARWYKPKFERTMKNAVARALRRAKSAAH